MKKRLFAGLLTLVMIVSLVPMPALAVEDDTVVVPCTKTEGCILADGHEGGCVLSDELEDGDSNGYYEFEDVTDPVQPTAEEQLAEMIEALPDPAKIDPLDEEQMEAVYNQISAIYAFAEENGLGDRDNGLLDEAANATVNAVIAAMNFVQTLTEPDTTITIEEDTIWNDATTLSGNLTVNSNVTLTIGAQVTISGNVTISGGGTIKRAESYTGDIDQYTADSTDADGNPKADAPKTAHLFYVPASSSLTLTNITIDGNAGWNLNETALM